MNSGPTDHGSPLRNKATSSGIPTNPQEGAALTRSRPRGSSRRARRDRIRLDPVACERSIRPYAMKLENSFAWQDYAHSRSQNHGADLASPRSAAALPARLWRMV